jgi:hypothetical protein
MHGARSASSEAGGGQAWTLSVDPAELGPACFFIASNMVFLSMIKFVSVRKPRVLDFVFTFDFDQGEI